MTRPCRLAALALALGSAAAGAADRPPSAPPVVFEGFGLGDLSAAESVSRALRATAVSPARDAVPLDVVVRGPGGGTPDSAPAPLAAEIRGRIDALAVAAGFQGDAQALVERTPQWTGRIGLGTSGPDGGETLELRTRLESRADSGRLGVEIGPRIERRLPRGARLILDGAATAEAVRDDTLGGWQFPGTPAAEVGGAAVGVSARTGIVR